MRIAQIILPGASLYESKSQRADREALRERHEVVVTTVAEAAASGAEVAHVYASRPLPARQFRRFPLPYVSSMDVERPRLPFGRPVEPDFVVSPLAQKSEDGRMELLPEAVEEEWFAPVERRPPTEIRIVGTYARPDLRNAIDQTRHRIERFRDDVRFRLFDQAPRPADLAGVDAWVDPALSDSDFDGCVAEALVLGLPVVATRTPINESRLEKGRTGLLVPPGDPNEMTHAILAVLFKQEVAESRKNAARQTVSKFRSRQRLRVLAHMYETLIS
jgi:hypothetical protein